MDKRIGQNMKPMLSVCMPAYNTAAYIGEAIASVLQSDYRPIELIIVDDGSQDNTTQIVAQYASKHQEIRFFEQENAGPAKARNKAIREAHGTYILPLDADDILCPGWLSDGINALETNPKVKAVTCRGKFFGLKNGAWSLPKFDITKLGVKNMMSVTTLFRREDALAIGGFDESLIAREDWEFWINLLKNGGEVIQLDAIGLKYRVRENSKRITDRKHKQIVTNYFNWKHASFYAKTIQGPLRSSYSWTRLINRCYNAIFPVKWECNSIGYEDIVCRLYAFSPEQIMKKNNEIFVTNTKQTDKGQYIGYYKRSFMGLFPIYSRFIYIIPENEF